MISHLFNVSNSILTLDCSAIRQELGLLDPQHQQLYSQYIDPSTGQFRAEVTKDHNQLNRLWFSLQDTDFDGELDGYELLMSMGDGVHSEQAIPLKEAMGHVDHILGEDDTDGK